MTDQQIGMIRSALTALGGIIMAYFGQKGLLSPEQQSFLTAQGPALLGLAMTVIGMVWSLIAHKQSNMVATVAAMTDLKPADQAVLASAVAEMPSVGLVVAAPTVAGDALAAAAPSASVVPAVTAPATPLRASTI